MRTKLSPLFIAFLIGASIFSVLILPIPEAHASSPTIRFNNHKDCGPPASTCTSAAISVLSGDILVVMTGLSHQSGAHAHGAKISTLTDSAADACAKDVAQGNFPDNNLYSFFDAEIWHCTSATTASVTVTMTANVTVGVSWFMAFIDLSGTSAPASSTGSGGCSITCSSLTTVIGAVTYTANQDLLVNAALTNNQTQCPFQGDYRQFLPFDCTSSSIYQPQSFAYSYPTDGTSGTMQSNQHGACQGNNCYYSDVGAVFPGVAPAPGTVIVTVPCTFFQLQCWLYPMFFFSVYLILTVGMAVAGEVPSRDIQGLVLEALSISSLLAVIIGMINIMIPLSITILAVVRAIRE